jgi:hypothetical protein
VSLREKPVKVRATGARPAAGPGAAALENFLSVAWGVLAGFVAPSTTFGPEFHVMVTASVASNTSHVSEFLLTAVCPVLAVTLAMNASFLFRLVTPR